VCGIVGKLNLTQQEPVSVESLAAMLGMIRHRGPDQFGVYVDDTIGLGSARLSIIDLASGQQPIHNEDETIWLVFNGEIFNYLELRASLEARGHRFYTQTDTEVIVHLYEDRGPEFVQALNGQFAIALWDRSRRELLLVRDRLGIRPIYYVLAGGRLLFGSEVKALLADPSVSTEIDREALAQIFTLWATVSPRSIFCGIKTIPPGHMLRVRDGQIAVERYWSLDFSASEESFASLDEAASALRELLIDATRLRLRADVPVGAYLSGGLDSSTTAMLIRRYTGRRLRTFGVGFSDPAFDETPHQMRMRDYLSTEHSQIHCTPVDIGRVLPEVVWHAEMPLLRTSPAPMFLLSDLVHRHDFKVVLTGEGADEILAGYNIFKEAAIRRFWARRPDSLLRPQLLRRLYPYVGRLGQGGDAYLRAFFGQGLTETDDPFYSHRVRWRNTSRCRRFLSADVRCALADYDPLAELGATLPPGFADWGPLPQAQYLEITIFLAGYLLSSQGDRMTMAHSVEGRYPFLDHRVVEFCVRLPARFKLLGLQEKRVLKRAMSDLLPDAVVARPKQPYRAPIRPSFFGPDAPDYVGECTTPTALREAGCFAPAPVGRLLVKCRRGLPLGETDEMALVGILSTQLLHRDLLSRFGRRPPVPVEDLFVCQASQPGVADVAQGPTSRCQARGRAPTAVPVPREA